MPQTPLTGVAPYLTAARVWLYKDARPILELLLDDDTIATQANAQDSTIPEGKVLLAALVAASGDVESRAMVGGRYLPTDLAAFTGNVQGRLEGLIADLAFWRLSKRRYPRLKPEDVSGASEAMAELDKLESGETIFGTQEAVDAGLPAVTLFDERKTIHEARRFFGDRGCERSQR